MINKKYKIIKKIINNKQYKIIIFLSKKNINILIIDKDKKSDIMIRLIKQADNSNIDLTMNMINDNIVDHIYKEIQNDFINFLSKMLKSKDKIEFKLLYFLYENKNFKKILDIYCTPIINKYHLNKYAITDLYDHICRLIYKKYNLDIINKLNKKLKII